MRRILNALTALWTLMTGSVAFGFYLTTDATTVPMHWNLFGEENAYGPTWTILLLAVIAASVFVLLLWYQMHPELGRWPFRIVNLRETARLHADMVAWMSFLVATIFLYIVVAIAQLHPFHGWIVYLVLVAITYILIYYTARIRRLQR
ncbi:MAG: hypothetical protein IJV27_11160 [Prevotella sp.]|nr:hypothetical protein [Prevotella sp.]